MESNKINATEGKVNILMDNIINSKIDNRNFEKIISDKFEESKIQTGVITKYYPYLDKAEVRLDKTNKLVLCRILHLYGKDLIDLYTPLQEEQVFDENLKEPAIIPKLINHVAVLPIRTNDKDDHLLLGYFNVDDIVGFSPSTPGNLTLTSITEPNLYWIKFGRDGLDLRLPKIQTEEVGTLPSKMEEVEYYTKPEVDDLLKNIGTGSGTDTDLSDNISYTELLKLMEDYKQTSEDKYTLFRGDCWTINNNYESSASITSTGDDNLKITGTFRTLNDMVGLYWYSKDSITHPYISYGERTDYSNVVLEFDYKMTNCRDFNFEGEYSQDGKTLLKAPVSITIETNHGEIYYVTMNRFVTVETNEQGEEVNHFRLDFEDLNAQVDNEYLDSRGNKIKFKEGDNLKIPVNDIKYILFVIVPPNFVENNLQYTIMENLDFDCEIYNIQVTGGDICNEHIKLEPHKYRLCEGYDDFYDLNPRRVAREMRKLGYAEWVDLYIGASHYYEKSGTVNEVIPIDPANFTHERTEKMTLIKEVPLNRAFMAWLDCYSRELKLNGCENLIISVSMENLQCPSSWRQKANQGNSDNEEGYALTGWVPSTFFYSPCNNDVIHYMQMVSMACLDIVVANDMKPILQMGEAWWWWNEKYCPTDEDGNPIDVENWQPPCFYDDATKNKYREEFNKELPVYTTSWVEDYDKSVAYWLNKQLVNYSDRLRDVVKSDRYTDGVYMALFFPPSVLDEDRVPSIMKDVNYIQEAYSPIKLDILQLEDYDWVTGLSPETKERDRSHHQQVYTIGQDLGFLVENLHYYGGFVQYPKDATEFWREIKKSMDDAIAKGFAEVYVWAGTQVRRDNKVLGYDKYELVQHLLYK